MLGMVLCGGQSNRMGTDKGLIDRQGVSWAAIARDKLLQLDIEVKLSVNAGQFPIYAEKFGAENLIVDNSSCKVSGPLLALMTANDRFPREDLFILACDMPDMQVSLLSKLVLRYNAFPGSDAYVYTNKEMIEPVCGIYGAGAVLHLRNMYSQGRLQSLSIRHFLRELHTDISNIPPG